MNAPFKVGDVVTVMLSSSCLTEYHGREFVIDRIYLAEDYWLVDVAPNFAGYRDSKRGWQASRFMLIAPAVPKNPVMERINKLYKKCKITQHWSVNDAA